MKVEKMDRNQRYLAKQASLINATAQSVYGAVQGGIDLNFFLCYEEYEDGVFGWKKEHVCFMTAIEIYENFTGNDGWDIYNQIMEEFESIKLMQADEIKEWDKIEYE